MNVGKEINMIEIKNLKLLNNKNRLRLNIPHLIIQPPGILAVVGHNGAGKSSLLSIIAGIEKPFTGSVHYEGKNTFTCFEELKNKIHLISWNISLYQNMTGNNHLNLIKNLTKVWNIEIENELIKDFFIPMNKNVDMLSRGEQAKLKLLLSLPCMPSVVLLDEVTNELDTDSRRAIYKKLDFYSFETSSQVIVATNMVDDIERYATSIAILRNGEVVLHGNLDAIKEERKASFEDIVRLFERVV